MSVVFYVALMPETKEVPLEDIGYLFGKQYERQDNSSGSHHDVSDLTIDTTVTEQGTNSNSSIF